MEVRTSGIVGLVFAVVAIVCTAVGVGSTWESNTNTNSSSFPPITVTSTYTLWKACTKVSSSVTVNSGLTVTKTTKILEDGCYSISDIEERSGTSKIIRILLYASIAYLVVAIVTAIIRHFVLRPWLHQRLQTILTGVVVILCSLAGCTTIASIGLYNETVMMEDSCQEVAFVFTLIAWMCSWTSAMFFLFGHVCCEAPLHR